METSRDKARALALAIGLHVVCFGLMFVGLLWDRTPETLSVRGSVIEATLMSAPPAGGVPEPTPAPAEEVAEVEQAPAPQPVPEPAPQTADEAPQPQPQAPVPQPDTVDQERVAQLAEAEAEARAEEAQRERQRQEQVLLDEQERQEEAERMQRLRELEEEREAQLADIRRQREAAEAVRRREAERLAQLEDLRRENTPSREAAAEPSPPATQAGNNGTDDSLAGRYQIAIQQVVRNNWLRPDSARPGIRCRLRIVQIPGGEVIQASVSSPCNADELTRRSIEAAVLKAQPLPYRGFESVFAREITFNFSYDGN